MDQEVRRGVRKRENRPRSGLSSLANDITGKTKMKLQDMTNRFAVVCPLRNVIQRYAIVCPLFVTLFNGPGIQAINDFTRGFPYIPTRHRLKQLDGIIFPFECYPVS